MTFQEFLEQIKNMDKFSANFGWLCGFATAYALWGIEIFLDWYKDRKK